MDLWIAMDEDQLARLHDAFSQRCTSAWLGHGNVLVLGFGERAMSPVDRRAPYDLNTNFASWRIEYLGVPTTSVESLLGQNVEAWELLDRLGLRLVFTGSHVLTVEPWSIADGVSDAWSVSAPDHRILAVSNDGRTVVVPTELPISDWFAT